MREEAASYGMTDNGSIPAAEQRTTDTGREQAVTDCVHDVRFCSCLTRNGAEERGLSAHVVFRRRKKEGGLSAHVVLSSFLLRVPQQLQPGREKILALQHYLQSISVIRPAVLAGETGPCKQVGPVSSTVVER